MPIPFLPCPARWPGLQDLVDLAKPGDRITVTGVYRAMGVRTNPRLRELKVRLPYTLAWGAAGSVPCAAL